MHMGRKQVKLVTGSATLVAIIAGSLLFPTTAVADKPSWYAGASLGRVFVDRNVSDFDDGSISSGHVDTNDSGHRLFVGYRFSDAFALEGGYVNLNNDFDGETTFNGISDGSGTDYASGPVSVDIDEPSGWFAVAVSSTRLSEHVLLNAKLGAMAWEAEETTIDTNGESTRNRDGTGLVAGLELEYRFQNNIALRSGWDFFRDVANEDYEFFYVSSLYYFE